MEPLRDPSTGVFSREAFVQFGSLMVSQAVRRNVPLGVLVVGLDDSVAIEQDGTKQIVLGALMALIGILQATIRAGDFIGRHGPRSLAVMAQDAHQAGALRFAERIRSALPDRLTVLGVPTPFRVSIGIATMPEAGTTFDELFRGAESAVAQATARGGNRDWLINESSAPSALRPQPAAPAPATPSAFELADITIRRRLGLAEAKEEIQRGEADGIAVFALAGACPICMEAARDMYQPHMLPTLPLIGCTTPGGCRCLYIPPSRDPRRQPPALNPGIYQNLDIPRRLHDAARFGAHARGGCKAEDLAEYLDLFPLFPFDADIELHANEMAYLKREARRAREPIGMLTQAVPGTSLPLEGDLRSVEQSLAKPPPSPSLAFGGKGNVYITNWRVLFRTGKDTDSFLLVDVAQIECFRDAIACTVGSHPERIVFALKDPVQVALVLAQAVRATLLAPV